MYKIVIKNTVTNQEYVYDNIEDINGGKKLYYNFNIDTSNLSDGEYKLTLFKGDDIVCTELLKVGDFNSDKIQYSKGANVFIDAKPEIELSKLIVNSSRDYIAEPNKGWNVVEGHFVYFFDCEKFGYKMHNLPYEYFYSNTGDAYKSDWWWGNEFVFLVDEVRDFENFFMNCPNLKEIAMTVYSATNMNNMIDSPENIVYLYLVGLGCSFSYAPYTNLYVDYDFFNWTLRELQEVWDKEETPVINLAKYLDYVDENAIAAAVNKGWLITGVNLFPEYIVNLNDQWRLSEETPNPDPEQFDGVYESFSNWNVDGGTADMRIEIENYSDFTIYIRSDAESSYDYVDVYELDKKYTGNVYATTQNKQNSGTDIGAYQKVTFNNIPTGKHTIYIRYKKDGSTHKGTDRGYVLIPKHQ